MHSAATLTEGLEGHLRRIGAGSDEDIDLLEVGLTLARLADPQAAVEPYHRHLAEIARDVAAEVATLTPADSDAAGVLAARAAALRAVLCERHGYQGDTQTYDDLQNANLMRVIDRRLGLPVALGILYMGAAHAQGWSMVGLNFPGHFLVRLQHTGLRAILDPFNGGRVCRPGELRELVKASGGDGFELQPEHYAEVGNRDVLVRLQNNIKTRLIQAGELAQAASIINRMLLFAPQHIALHAEFGVLQAQLGNLRAAEAALETFLVSCDSEPQRQRAAEFLRALRGRLN